MPEIEVYSLLVILVLASGAASTASFIMQPRNVTAIKGNDAFFPCTAMVDGHITSNPNLWIIGGYPFTGDNLPPGHDLTENGIVVNSVDQSQNLTSYSCQFIDSNFNRLKSVPPGYLIVVIPPKYEDPRPTIRMTSTVHVLPTVTSIWPQTTSSHSIETYSADMKCSQCITNELHGHTNVQPQESSLIMGQNTKQFISALSIGVALAAMCISSIVSLIFIIIITVYVKRQRKQLTSHNTESTVEYADVNEARTIVMEENEAYLKPHTKKQIGAIPENETIPSETNPIYETITV